MVQADNKPGQATTRSVTISSSKRELRLFMVAGEHSGDALGGRLMEALNVQSRGRVRYLGVGGPDMRSHGLISQFPLSDVAVMGPAAILKVLPRLVRRVYRTVDAAVAAQPDAVVIIDAPEFTHPIAKRIRQKLPDVPIIDYVSPSVWGWRPGRARRMRSYVDHVMALLPFEPEVHQRLGGPPCTYIGHPLVERQAELASIDPSPLRAELGLQPGRPVLVVLPGSRRSEVERLMQPFGETLTRMRQQGMNPEVLIPIVPHVRDLVEQHLKSWPVTPYLLEGEAAKFQAFKLATAALAASGTVTLELALTGTPMVVGYKVDALAAKFRFLLKVQSIVLANLVLGENAFPEFKQEDCTGARLSEALMPLLSNTEARARQMLALGQIPAKLHVDQAPSAAAADIVLAFADGGRGATI
jgi:lipid-A-disaccharide synthase